MATASADDEDGDTGGNSDGDDDGGGGGGGGGGGDDDGNGGGGDDDAGGAGGDDYGGAGGDDDGGAGGDDDGGAGADDDDLDDTSGSGLTNSTTAPGPVGRGSSQRDRYSAAREILAIDADPEVLRALEASGFVARERRTLPSLEVSISRLTIPGSLSLPAALARARRIAPTVAYQPNPVYRIAEAAPETGPEVGQHSPPPCNAANCYSFNLVGWPDNPEDCGVGLRIGMTDTAVDRDHPALRRQDVQHRRFAPVGPELRSPTDHGTAMAALLVGDPASGFSGMLPSASLYAADVFHLDSGGIPQATLTDLVNGLDWLAGQQVSVINISMTGPPNHLLESAIQTLDGRGIGIVSAAGNGGPVAAPAFPAAYESVVSVTAIGQDLRIYRLANRGDYIAFASPGVGIWSAAEAGTGRHRTGTSVASAYVSAAIAEIMDGGTADIGTTIRRLQRGALDLGAPGHDPIFGWGLIQASPSCGG